MALYLGKGQVGICQRSGQKMLRANMVEDGQVKGLLVHPDWYEPYHPQLVPPPMRADGIARQRPAPDVVPAPTAAVLAGVLQGGPQISLSWTPATSPVSNIDQYRVFRSVDAGLYSLLATLPVVLDTQFNTEGFWEEIDETQNPYVDTTVTATHTYRYYIIADAQEGGSIQSNTVVVPIP